MVNLMTPSFKKKAFPPYKITDTDTAISFAHTPKFTTKYKRSFFKEFCTNFLVVLHCCMHFPPFINFHQ